jgi:hypothetical protein
MYDKNTFCLGDLSKKCNEVVTSNVLNHLGWNNKDHLQNTFNGIVLPVRILTINDTWKMHNHTTDMPIAIIDDGKVVYGCDHSNIYNNTIKYLDVKDIVDHYKLSEDQYKFPNRKMIEKQTCFRSSFNKSISFGGIGECMNGENIKLKSDVISHDGHTILKSGTIAKIVDNDLAGLPDLLANGTIVNVDWDSLKNNYEYVIVNESEFNNKLNNALGIVDFVNPDIILVVNNKLRTE